MCLRTGLERSEVVLNEQVGASNDVLVLGDLQRTALLLGERLQDLHQVADDPGAGGERKSA